MIDLDVADGVATLTINRPHRRNALAFSVHHRLGELLERVASRPDVRFIILRGSAGVFSSGGDVADLGKEFGAEYLLDYWQRMQKTVLLLRRTRQIVVAVVEGAAAGAGAALAISADVVLAAEDARFRWNFVKLGLLPDAGTTATLTRSLGEARTRELLLTGRWMPAVEAQACGLVARLAPSGNVDAMLTVLLAEIADAPPYTLALLKNMLEGAGSRDLQTATRLEGVYQLAAAASGDYHECVARLVGSLGTGANGNGKRNGVSPTNP